jgi:Fe-Mn family superoxide dismutase
MPFTLAPLPYDASAFGETISKRTFDFHHGKHHKAYVDKTNAALGEKGLEGAGLAEVIRAARAKGDQGLFNNSGQTWNHNFYWQCLSPERQSPGGQLKAKLEEAFGSVDAFLEQF